MSVPGSHLFETNSNVLSFDPERSILLCRDKENRKKLWAKKIREINLVNDVIEDEERFYLSCETDDTSGRYLALRRSDGSTEWFIPGRAFFHRIVADFIYAIFIDEERDYYLLKVDRAEGKRVWHRRVSEDLCEYSITAERILLTFRSGKTETISPLTGRPL